ncbi:MAG: Tim44/TimA family putative adaptor protein [Rhodobacteraceae bacterium]|nr:Tim44/TimA family putative adaptor protein [Paracoccaceae bacterium]
MASGGLQLLILAAAAVFMVIRLYSVLGTRDGFEGNPEQKPDRPTTRFDVIEGGGVDADISDHADPDSPTGQALLAMKKTEPGFSVSEFLSGSRQAFEMIVMAFENGDQEFLKKYLAPDIFDSFSGAIIAREDQGLTVDAKFIGVREISLKSAKFNEIEKEGEITIRFVGELTSVVKDADGKTVEGSPDVIKKQTAIWTFARLMGTNNPDWLLVATDE